MLVGGLSWKAVGAEGRLMWDGALGTGYIWFTKVYAAKSVDSKNMNKPRSVHKTF